MRTPSTDAKQGFTAFFASHEGQEDLRQRLDAVIKSQQEATPEPSSSDHESSEDDHQWQCNILHDQFDPTEVDNIRSAIWQGEYWMAECQCYATVLGQLLFHSTAHQTTARQWQSTASLYAAILHLHGISAKAARLSIKSQQYWEEEKQVLQQQAAQKEGAMREAACARKKDIERRRRERVERCLQATEEPSAQLESIATRTRSWASRQELPKRGVQRGRITKRKATNQQKRQAPHASKAD